VRSKYRSRETFRVPGAVSGLAGRGDLSDRNADRSPLDKAEPGELDREPDLDGSSNEGFPEPLSILTVLALPGSDIADAEVPERPDREEAGVLDEGQVV
jgi:hypothetical protein